MSRDAKIGLLVVFASITLGLFLGFTEVMDREYIKVNGKDDDDGAEDNDDEPDSDPIIEPPTTGDDNNNNNNNDGGFEEELVMACPAVVTFGDGPCDEYPAPECKEGYEANYYSGECDPVDMSK